MEPKSPPTPDPAVQPPALPTGQQPPDQYHAPTAAPEAPPHGPAPLGDDVGIRMLLPVDRSAWAIAAGYLGLFSLTGVLAPVSVIVSVIAIREIRRSRDTNRPKHGLGRAVFGLIMGIFGTVMLLLFLLPLLAN